MLASGFMRFANLPMRTTEGSFGLPFTPLTFTGISQYSDDLNTVLQRAVSIASLPLKRLQNDDADILTKKTTLASLTASVGTLGASVAALGSVASSKAIVATSSDS